MNQIAHIEINVSNLEKSKKFYTTILKQLNWTVISSDDNSTGFKGEDNTHLFLLQTKENFISNIFHRKNTGLNHIAFRVESREKVESFSNLLGEMGVKTLYTNGPSDYSKEYQMEQYFAVFFEDPDRIKLEVVFMK